MDQLNFDENFKGKIWMKMKVIWITFFVDFPNFVGLLGKVA